METTQKQRTVVAIKKMIKLYDHPDSDHEYFDMSSCVMCQIQPKEEYNIIDCNYCILYKDSVDKNCIDHTSFKKAQDAFAAYTIGKSKRIDKTFKARADFYRKVLKIVEASPARRFTKSGFREFDEIKLEW